MSIPNKTKNFMINNMFIIVVVLAIQLSMGQTMETKQIKLSGQNLEINYLKAGKGKQKWVLVHGLGSYSKAYNKILAHLPKEVEAYALDLPGFGESPLGNQTISMAGYAHAVNDFVNTLGLKKVVLFGHSMGGQVAMTLALENPKWLKSLVLLAPAGIEQFTEKDKEWFGAVVNKELYLNLSDDQIRQNFNVNFYGFQLPEDALFMYQDRMKIKEDSAKYKQYCITIVHCIKAMLSGQVYDQLESIKTPILVFYGKNDALIPNKILHPDLTIAQLTEKLNQDYPEIQTELVDKAGHFVLWDQTETIIKETEKFIDAHK